MAKIILCTFLAALMVCSSVYCKLGDTTNVDKGAPAMVGEPC